MIVAIPLTEQQRQAIEAQQGRPVEVVDPATNRVYVLVAAETYERVRDVLEGTKNAEPAGVQDGGAIPGAEHSQGCFEIPQGIRRSQEAFWRDLPELLRDKGNLGKWAAYHGEEQVGTARTKTELIREVLRRGVPRNDYYVGRIRAQDLPPWEPVEVEPIHSRHLEDILAES